MGRGTVNQRRGLRSGQCPARYWRLRFADDSAERLAELEPDEAREHDEHDGWYRWIDPRQTALDRAIAELCVRIRGAMPFHTLALGDRAREWSRATSSDQPIEARLIDHIEHITTRELDQPERTDDLLELEAIAERHFRDDLGFVLGLALFQPFWLRSPATWCPREPASFASLVEHLLLAYPAPRFLYAAALDLRHVAELRWMAYLIALGQGGSVRRLAELGRERWPDEWAVIPHKLVACLGRVHEQHSPRSGLMEAEVLRVGGSAIEHRRLCSDHSFAFDPTAAEKTPEELGFWRTTVEWLTRHREQLTDDDATVILAWARHMQIEQQRIGEPFRWRGRTAASALREATAYRDSLQRHRWNRLSWRHHGWDWQGSHGDLGCSIHELIDSAQLHDESQAMSHCVYSYAHACWSGRTAIFSLRQDGRRRVTIELNLASKRVVQAKRAYNQEPSALEWAVIQRWTAGLQ